MSLLSGKSAARWSLTIVTIAVALGAGRISVMGLSADARAASATLSPLDRLVAEADIRQKLATYGFYADGDGVNPKDTKTLADTTMTQDVVNELHPPTGGPGSSHSGRDFVAGTTPVVMPAPDRPTAGRHFLVATSFDEMTPTTAKTRTNALHLTVTRNLLGADCKKAGEDACGGRVVRAVTWVYHTEWAKTPQGWEMTRNALYSDN